MTTVWHVGGEDVHMRIPLLKRLAGRGYCVGAVGTSEAAYFDGTGIDYFELPLSRWVNPFSDLVTLFALRRLIRLHEPDIVHGFDTKPSLLAPLAVWAAQGSTRSVRTINGMGYLYSERNITTIVLRPVYELAQRAVSGVVGHTIFQNSTDQQFFEKRGLLHKTSFSLIKGSGVVGSSENEEAVRDQMLSAASEFSIKGRNVVIMVARLVENKGVTEFLQAARNIRQHRKDVVFLLVGPYASEGTQAVKKEVLDQYRDDAVVTGPRQDVPALLLLSSVFVLPTKYREGVPRALLEAAVTGLPLVATKMPGCFDVVSDGENGLLVEPGNAEALSGAINAILDDLPLWRSRAEARREAILGTFGIETVAQAHARVYEALLSHRK